MMDAVLISIKPEWVDLILSGKKIIEVRKGLPNLKQPFKVYIYCTKGNGTLHRAYDGFHYHKNQIGKEDASCVNGKVVAEFTCNAILEWNKDDYGANCYDIDDDSFEAACIPLMSDYWDYGKGKTLYGWRISDLKIYNEPHDVTEFMQTKYIRAYHSKSMDKSKNIDIDFLLNSSRLSVNILTRAPQSWCYVDSRRF